MQVVLSPNCAALIAATYPPGPPPITTTSVSSIVAYALSADAQAPACGRRSSASAARLLARLAIATPRAPSFDFFYFLYYIFRLLISVSFF
jgi:hypothetical protein